VKAGAMEVVQAAIMDRTMLKIAKGWVLYVCNKEEQVTTPLQE